MEFKRLKPTLSYNTTEEEEVIFICNNLIFKLTLALRKATHNG